MKKLIVKAGKGIFANRWIRGGLVEGFHICWWHSKTTWQKNTFLGFPILQCPLDLQIYQELVWELKPSAIVQTGVAGGGSLLYFATLLDLAGVEAEAPVIGIDVTLSESAQKLTHPRLRLIEGSSIDPRVIDEVGRLLDGRRGMVCLDSDHSCDHVFAEMESYQRFVGPDSYLVVEDTNLNGHPVSPSFGPGPAEAVAKFMEQYEGFTRDNDLWERNLFSFHQGRWLRKSG